MMNVATSTIIELLCSSPQVGHDTLCRSSSTAPSMYALIFNFEFVFTIYQTVLLFARVGRLEHPTCGFGDRCSAN